MTDAERDSLIRAMALAVRDLQQRHDSVVASIQAMTDTLHNLSQRVALQEIAGVIEEIQEGDIPARKH